MSLRNKIQRSAVLGEEFIKKIVIEEWEAQGKVASGKSKKTFTVDSVIESGSIIFIGKAEEYMVIQDKGVTAENWRIGWKKWKEVGTKWIRDINKSFSSQKDRNNFLYFTWLKHKEKGMPTKESIAFSENGRRTNWSKHTVEDRDKLEELKNILNLEEIIQLDFEKELSLVLV